MPVWANNFFLRFPLKKSIENAQTYFNVPPDPGEKRRQRFVPVIPQPFAIRSASISCKEKKKVNLSEMKNENFSNK